MASKAVIQCVDVVKEFPLGKDRAFGALQGVNLDIKAGEFVILIGPSGSGKSTILNLIAGLERPTSGSIFIRGQDITKFDHNQLANHHRVKMGMVFQQFNLIPTLSVLENVALPQIFAKRPPAARVSRAHHLLQLFDIDKYADNSPTELSGGEQQRVAIARALVNNPWILLVDEPTGNLDSKNGDEVMKLISDLNRHSRRTILLVTHDTKYLHVAHRIIHILDGKVVRIERRHGLAVHPKSTSHKFASLREEEPQA